MHYRLLRYTSLTRLLLRWTVITANQTAFQQGKLAQLQSETSDWNDLRLVLTIARARGLTGAKTVLGIDHSTVFRRLSAIEVRAGTPLFERMPGGVYEPTPAGQLMVAAATQMQETFDALQRRLTGADPELTGLLRVTSSETIAHRLLMTLIATFRQVHPAIQIHLSIENRVLNLARREADVALRPMRPVEKDLWGRRLAMVAWGLYGASGTQPALHIEGQPLVGWDEQENSIAAAAWLAQAAPASAILFRCNSLLGQAQAARAGLGLAVLPCYLGDNDPLLTRALPDPIPDLVSEMWLVTHTDLRRTARVRAFFDVVVAGIAQARPLIEGLTAPGIPHPP